VVASAAAAAGGRVLLAGERVPVTAVYDQVLTGHPAIVWVTYDFRLHPRHDYLAWDGRWVPYAGPYEHTVTVVGFDGATVLVNDPARGVSRLGKLTFEAGYGVYDGMAVVLR